jgi:hypothetical protein
LIKEILRIFGAASGLVTKIRRSSVTPIRCQEQDLEVVQNTLPCSVVNFPCRYLGMPLSVRKLSKTEFLLLIEKITDYLPSWKAALMHPASRVALIWVVLTVVPIHHFIVVQCPKWVLKAINKIIRAFLEKGHKDVKGGHCLVGWQHVCLPIDLGGLGILNLEVLSLMLQTRWLWLRKTQPDQPWMSMDIHVHPNVTALFSVSVISMVGDGKSTCFWTDRWLHGHNIADLAPTLFALVPKSLAKKQTIQEALENHSWEGDIRGSLQAQGLLEFILL